MCGCQEDITESRLLTKKGKKLIIRLDNEGLHKRKNRLKLRIRNSEVLEKQWTRKNSTVVSDSLL